MVGRTSINNSRSHIITSFPITATTAFSIISMFIFFSFSRTKTVSISAASSTTRFGIMFLDVGFPDNKAV
jgi:hypothetical protein